MAHVIATVIGLGLIAFILWWFFGHHEAAAAEATLAADA